MDFQKDTHQETEGQPKAKKKYFDVHAPVFYPATILIIIFIVLTLLNRQTAESFFLNLSSGISHYTGWFLILCVNIFLIFALVISILFGRIRIGGPAARPEFSTISWFSMLFSAGMGIGILFFSVAEPVSHLIEPPENYETMSIEAARSAMGFTFLHWGLHVWAIYASVGLSLAYFSFSRKLPLSIRSVFSSLLGKGIYGPAGNMIDILAVLATLFGLATSLGLGVRQVASGLNHLFNFPSNVESEIFLIFIITAIATISVVLGIHRGVRFLSELNIRIAAIFLLAVIVLGPTVFIMNSMVENTGYYLHRFVELSFYSEAYIESDWQSQWTVFYWSWWISWSPFVGMFIARISYGRTVRQFILGVLLIPSIITFLWLSAFGGSALFFILGETGDNIIAAVNDDYARALFALLERFPAGFILSIIAVVLITNFFVTSSDSGSLVIDSLTSGGKYDAPVGQRIFWAVSEGVVAAVLLLGGGLIALQTGTITTGLPFSIVLLLMCFSLFRGLKREQDAGLTKILKQDADLISREVHGDIDTD